MHRYPRRRTPSRLVVASAMILTLLAASTVMAVSLLSGRHGPSPKTAQPVPAATAPAATTPTVEPTDQAAQTGIRKSELDADVARLRAAPKVTTDSPLPRITGDPARQPDLYAAAFSTQLLTQDYRRPREGWVSWVQAESAHTDEPLVIGLVPPELRDRWATFSVTDTSDGPAPIPTTSEWAKLAAQAGRTSVRIQRVTEPMAWTNAVEAGRITDPGITARIVSAEVTLTTVVDGHTRTRATSVELGLEFEGPPTRGQWGFVGAVTYTAIPMGTS
jgi:hypothetical protein